MLILIGLVSILVLTAGTGYFVAQEFAYVAADRSKLRQAAEDGDAAAARALRVTSQLSFTLSGAQFGITLTALLVGYVSEPYLGEGLAQLLGWTGLSEVESLSIALVAALAFSTVVQMVFGELAPKNYAIARPETLARRLSRSTLLYLTLAGPLIRLFDAASNKLLRAVGIEPVEELPHGVTPEDPHRIIDESREGGHLGSELSLLLDRGLGFRERVADQIMTPRVDVRTVSGDEPVTRVVELLDTGHSRFPVVGDGIDDVIGVVGIAEVLTVSPASRATTPIRKIAAAPLLIPASLSLPAVLERLRAEHRQLAVVMDEFGGFAGIVSLEDVAEEVVGEILDEDDHVEPIATPRPDGSWVIPGGWRLHQIAETTGIDLPKDDDYDTVSGLIMQQLGRIPEPGDHVAVALAVEAAVDEEPPPPRTAWIEVLTVRRHVPGTIVIRVLDDVEAAP